MEIVEMRFEDLEPGVRFVFTELTVYAESEEGIFTEERKYPFDFEKTDDGRAHHLYSGRIYDVPEGATVRKVFR